MAVMVQVTGAAVSMPTRIQRMDEFLQQVESGDIKLRVRVMEVTTPPPGQLHAAASLSSVNAAMVFLGVPQQEESRNRGSAMNSRGKDARQMCRTWARRRCASPLQPITPRNAAGEGRPSPAAHRAQECGGERAPFDRAFVLRCGMAGGEGTRRRLTLP